MIFSVASMPFPDSGKRVYHLDRTKILHHFVSRFRFDAQAAGSPMGNRQGIPVHLIRKNGLRVEDFIERQDLVIREGRVLRLRKRMEDNVTRLWQGTAHFQD